jgi:hypothetical protein
MVHIIGVVYLKCYQNVIMLMYIECKQMDIEISVRFEIWSDIHAHGYFRGRGTVRVMDLVLEYPPKPAPLSPYSI